MKSKVRRSLERLRQSGGAITEKGADWSDVSKVFNLAVKKSVDNKKDAVKQSLEKSKNAIKEKLEKSKEKQESLLKKVKVENKALQAVSDKMRLKKLQIEGTFDKINRAGKAAAAELKKGGVRRTSRKKRTSRKRSGKKTVSKRRKPKTLRRKRKRSMARRH